MSMSLTFMRVYPLRNRQQQPRIMMHHKPSEEGNRA